MKTMSTKKYEVLNKQAYESIKHNYAGLVFSREEKGRYFIMLPPKYANQLLLMNIIKEHE